MYPWDENGERGIEMNSSGRIWNISSLFAGTVPVLLLLICLTLSGCPATTEQGPHADFSATPVSGTVPLEVQFTDLSTPGNAPITQWAWLFGDGGESAEQNPAHSYAIAGNYNVSLTVTTATGEDLKLKLNYISVALGGEGEGEGESGTVTLPGNVPLTMIYVPAGSFMMGSPSYEQDRTTFEGPQHEVTLTQGFWTGTEEITKAQWEAVMGTTPWSGEGMLSEDPASPAVWIDWNDAHDFVEALNVLTGQTFRLPTEAEWEFACRGGTTTRYYWGDDPGYTAIGDNAWWTGNAWDAGERYAHVAGLKSVNPMGLYDMAGNVWEWCEDWYGGYSGSPETDPSGPVTGAFRIIRGGALDTDAPECRSAYRADTFQSTRSYSIGFRVVRN